MTPRTTAGSPRRAGPVLVAAQLLAVLGAGAEARAQPPLFERGPCPFDGGEWLERERIECGTMLVPESRGRAGGRMLRLAVAILRSHADSPSSDPVVFLNGGPGGAMLRFAPAVSRGALWNTIRERRDLVLWDQRGTGYSEPAFCPDLGARLSAAPLETTDPEELVRRTRSLLARCRERVLAEGLDFAAYNSAVSARDLDDLRIALGYERWNVFGGSYGTRLALIAARDVPDGIRSLILDSTSPTDFAGDASTNEDFLRSLGLVFEQCAADSACRTRFPDLEAEFHATVASLDADPFVVPMDDPARFPAGGIHVDGLLFARGMFQALYSEDLISLLPYAIREIRARNEVLVRALAQDLAPDPETLNPWLNHAVECYEQEPLLARDASGRGPRDTWLPDLGSPALTSVCDAWHEERADTALLRRPITSDIPTLIAAGEFDPITPPAHGRHVAAWLPRSQFIEVAGAGHGALRDPCTLAILAAFLEAPDRPLDTACLEESPGVTFVTDLHVAPGVSKAALDLADGRISLLVWLGATLLVLVSAPIGWGAAALARRVRKRPAPGRRGRTARALAGLTALVVVGFVGGLAWVVKAAIARNPYILAFGLPGEAGPLLALAWPVTLLAAATAVFAVLAWRRGWWGLGSRVHYSLVATAGASFVAVLGVLGLF
jgi:pimeloyl-ACP methyl ester carboxylesterase